MSEGDYPALVKQVDGRMYASKQKTSSPYLRDLWSDSLSRHVDSIQTQAYSQDTLTTKLSRARLRRVSGSLIRKGYASRALLPGGGPDHNRKYWKLPIVWGHSWLVSTPYLGIVGSTKIIMPPIGIS